MAQNVMRRGKVRSGSIVKRAAPLEHTASSLAAFQYLQALWGTTDQGTRRRALEEAARAAYWPGLPPEGEESERSDESASDEPPTTSDGSEVPSSD